MLDASRNPQLWPRRVPVPPPLGHRGLLRGMAAPPERHPEATVLLPSPVRWRAVLPKRGQQRSFRHAARLYDAPRWELGATRPSRIRPRCLGGGLLRVQVLKRHRRGQLSRSPLKLLIFAFAFFTKTTLKTTTNKQQQQFARVDKTTLTTNNNSGIQHSSRCGRSRSPSHAVPQHARVQTPHTSRTDITRTWRELFLLILQGSFSGRAVVTWFASRRP